MSNESKLRVLFLCTGNAARSIMAEAIANQLFGDHFQAHSAGSRPASKPSIIALQTLKRHGLNTEEARSKSWDEFAGDPVGFDMVITLCSSAAKDDCPVFPGAPVKAHWGLPDPPHNAPKGEHATDEEMAPFEFVFAALVEAMEMFLADPAPAIDIRTAVVAGHLARKFEGA